MLRDKGLIALSANIEPQVSAPLDARQSSKTFADLTNADNWLANDGSSYAYVTMLTVVGSDPDPDKNGVYWLQALPVTDPNNWVDVKSSGKLPTGLFTMKGRVDAYEDLPADGNVDGDVYLVGAEDATAFEEYVYVASLARFEYMGLSSVAYTAGDNIAISPEGVIDVTYTNTEETIIAVGGIKEGTTFDNASLSEIVEMMLYPELEPTLTPPTVTMEHSLIHYTTNYAPVLFDDTAVPGSSPYAIKVVGDDTHTTKDLTNTHTDWTIEGVTTTEIDFKFTNPVNLNAIEFTNPSVLPAGIEPVGVVESVTFYDTYGSDTPVDIGTPIPEYVNDNATVNATWALTMPAEDISCYGFRISIRGTVDATGLSMKAIRPVLKAAVYGSIEVVEVFQPYDIEFTTYFDKGAITPAYGTSGLRSGDIVNMKYEGPTLPTMLIPVGPENLPDRQKGEFLMFDSEGSTTWEVLANHLEGEQPLTSKGNNYSTPLAAGPTQRDSVTIYSAWPIFGTVKHISDMSMLELKVPGEYLEVELVAEMNSGFKQSIMWRATADNDLLGVEFFNTISNQWEWLGGAPENSAASFVKTTEEVTRNNNTETYKRYTNTSPNIGARKLRFYYQS